MSVVSIIDLFDSAKIGLSYLIQHPSNKMIAEFIKVDNNVFIQRFLFCEDLRIQSFVDVNYYSEYHRSDWGNISALRISVLDYIEEDSDLYIKTEKGACTCDLHSVVMVTGCKCGGK